MSYWFDPMVQTAGMPGYAGAVDQGQAYNASIAAQQAQQQAMLAQANAYNPWANTPGGFGGQTAYYAGLGAAYGRAVPQSSPAAVAAAGGGGQADRLRALYPGAFSGGGIGSDAARAPAAAAAPQPPPEQPQSQFDPWTDRIAPPPPPQTSIGGDVNANAYFNRLTGGMQPTAPTGGFSGGQADRLRALYGALPGDIGSGPQSRPMPNLGYNPGMANSFANPGMNANPFQNRFGMGFPNAGTPSQYAPGAQMPPGFSQPYSFDNPEGALTPQQRGLYQPGSS